SRRRGGRMTRYEIAIVACKITAIFMIVWGLASLCDAVRKLIFPPAIVAELPWLSFISPLPGLVWLVGGWYCWHSAGTLAWNMVDDDEQRVTAPDVRAEDLISCGCILSGLFVLVPAGLDFVDCLVEVAAGDLTFD